MPARWLTTLMGEEGCCWVALRIAKRTCNLTELSYVDVQLLLDLRQTQGEIRKLEILVQPSLEPVLIFFSGFNMSTSVRELPKENSRRS